MTDNLPPRSLLFNRRILSKDPVLLVLYLLQASWTEIIDPRLSLELPVTLQAFNLILNKVKASCTIGTL